MSEIGKRGFQSALDRGYGKYLATTVLGVSYRAKFGCAPRYTRNKAGDAARARRAQLDKRSC